MSRPRLLFIVGPTASGKTELSLREAESRGASILSCDSLCVYKRMDIGTAKPSAEEQARVPHFGIDLAEPTESFSVSRYIAYRDDILQTHREAGKPVVVVGGSGFYLKSFFEPVTDAIDIPGQLEQQVSDIHETRGLEGLVQSLIDHHGGKRDFPGLDLQNPRRVEKALIRCLASGKTCRELLEEFKSLPEPLADWEKEVWLINRSRDDLQARNRQRVTRMLEAGLISEVKHLREEGFENNPSAAGAIGYREVLAYLDNRISEAEIPEQIYVHTNQLMRKQRSWFQRQIPAGRIIDLS